MVLGNLRFRQLTKFIQIINDKAEIPTQAGYIPGD